MATAPSPQIETTQHSWEESQDDNATLSFKGCPQFATTALKISQNANSEAELLTSLEEHLKNQKDFTGGIIETSNYTIAWVDHIRSWPIFYYNKNNQFLLSNDGYAIKEKIDNPNYYQDGLLEFKMSGYVTGKETLIQDIFSLSPGEFLIWNKNTQELITKKYFTYIPTFDSQITNQDAIEQLNQIFDRLILKIIKKVQNKTIYIPLSGGLDSRILLCKLREHNYQNVKTFTYGPRFNFEALIAKKVAKKLNYPWRFVSVPRKKLKQYFKSDDRKKFWNFAGNLKSIPCMREYGAMRYLQESGYFDKDAIILNGQSGDYITGGHLSTACKENSNYNKNSFYDLIINTHYDLWKNHKTEENIQIIKSRIDNLLKSIPNKTFSLKTSLDGAIHEEFWEYEARQICYVVNGQRLYEYFGYQWEMPLWEKELVDFYQPLSFDMKYRQKIYKDYLQSYNYKNLFPEKEPYIWRWPLPMLWVVPMAQIIGLFSGRKVKDQFYALMRYHGHYANQYAFFNWSTHKKAAGNARSMISLYIPEWLKDHNLDF